MDFLSHPTEPIRVEKRPLSEILEDMSKTGFQGRKLGEAFLTWKEMLAEETTILMGLSGAMVPGGMRRVISYLIENNYIDVLVSTGANIFHDINEALGYKHYQGTPHVEDSLLQEKGIDRMHDIYASEENFRAVDRLIGERGEKLSGRVCSSREFLMELGKEIKRLGDRDSITVSSYENNLPLFVPALADSSIGIGLATARKRVTVDQVRDIRELTSMVEDSPTTGVVYIGGGVPKNFINQTEVVASMRGREVGGHKFGVQFTTDSPQFGGLSGSTFDEAVSWGKFSSRSRRVQVSVDATIALPLVVNALDELGMKRERSEASFFRG